MCGIYKWVDNVGINDYLYYIIVCNFLAIKSSHKTSQCINISVFNSENRKYYSHFYISSYYRIHDDIACFIF